MSEYRLTGYRGNVFPLGESPSDKAMRLYDEELGKNALSEDVAHAVANVMLAILDDLKGRSGIDSAFDQIDDETMAELEQSVCEKIEPHVFALAEETYDEAYEDGEHSAWRDQE